MKTLIAILLLSSVLIANGPAESSKPNIVIILTDDQGFGELGVTGNPIVRTPHIDRFAAQSVSLMNFHVMPVCSPTRACLMTGRYNYRTGVTDTFLGRSLMHPDETTLAQMLAAGGYRTGIFGKWHLGDNYPMRAMDKGFNETLVLNGGGLAQPGDPPDPEDERGAYFNATLRHNGAWVKTDGYVSDVITAAAIQFIEKKSDKPFFVYLPFNCPHAPHQVPPEYREHYSGKNFSATAFPIFGHPMAAKNDPDDLARVYGMIENIDDNVGRLLAKLDELRLADNTIVILFFIANFIIGSCNAAIRIQRITYLFHHIPNHIIGRANSIFFVINVFFRVCLIGVLTLPFFHQGTSIILSLLILASICGAGALVLLFQYKKLMRQPEIMVS